LFNAEVMDDPRAKRQLGKSQKQFYLDYMILNWAPALSRYSRYLPRDLETLQAGLTRAPARAGGDHEPVTLRYALHGADHGGPADLELGVTIRIRLSKTRQGFWRVDALSFDRSPDLPARSANS
jgi:hypothetical protein